MDRNTNNGEETMTDLTNLTDLSRNQLLNLEASMYDIRKKAKARLEAGSPWPAQSTLHDCEQDRVAWANTMIDRIEVALELATKKAAADAQRAITPEGYSLPRADQDAQHRLATNG